MNNKILALVLVAALAVGGLGYWLGHSQGYLGATVNYSNSMSNANLYASLASLAADDVAVRAPLAGLTASSTDVNFVDLSQGEVATTSLTGLGSSIGVGDWCVATVASTTAHEALIVSCDIIATGVAQVSVHSATGTTAITTDTVTVRAFDLGTFVAPAALQTSTSTSN